MNRQSPPSWAIRFFRWFCNDHLSDAVLGDMLELYARRRRQHSKIRADLLFLWNVIQFIQPFAIRKKHSTYPPNHFAMFRNFMKVAYRGMSRQKMYTGITIGGFAIGLATCIVIFLFIRNELSYDTWYKGKQVYRIYNEWNEKGNMERWVSMTPQMSTILKEQFPEVESSGRLVSYKWFLAGSDLVRPENNTDDFYQEGVAYADSSLLGILDIPMRYGDRNKALVPVKSVVLSREVADKFFPNENPVGKTMIFNEDKLNPYVIGGVMEELPSNTHFHFSILITLTGVEFWPGEQTNWCCWNYDTYVKLLPGADPEALTRKLTTVRDSYLLTYLNKIGDQSAADVKKYQSFQLQPAQDIHLNELGVEDNLKHGDARYIWLFGAIAVLILLLATINFINLATAKSANRAKEVGIRKVVGSVRGFLVRQFLTESLAYSFISFALGFLLAVLARPFFNQLSGKELFFPWHAWWLFPSLVGAAAVVGLLAGLYPAFYLSAFKPVDVLKGNIARGSKSSGLRSTMVIFQFSASIILIIGTFIIYRQVNFLLHTKVGFNKDQVVMVEGANTLGKETETFKNELRKLSDVSEVTLTNYLPVWGTNRDQNGFWKEGRSTQDKPEYGQLWTVDEDYLPTMGIKLLAGRNFNKDLASDTASIILNEQMVKRLGLDSALGSAIDQKIMNYNHWRVIGVVADFHFESMKGEIGPLCMVLGHGGDFAAVKVNSKNMTEAVQSIQHVWNEIMPHQPFRYSFLDQRYARMYEDVQRTGKIFATLAGLAILVACLGLFALSAFMVQQRSKEISIRLVLGASGRTIFRMLTQNFVKLVLISFLIATPVAWYMMHRWLEDYAYKIHLSWDVFAFAGLISVFIALVTISYQSVRAALANPAERLKAE